MRFGEPPRTAPPTAPPTLLLLVGSGPSLSNFAGTNSPRSVGVRGADAFSWDVILGDSWSEGMGAPVVRFFSLSTSWAKSCPKDTERVRVVCVCVCIHYRSGSSHTHTLSLSLSLILSLSLSLSLSAQTHTDTQMYTNTQKHTHEKDLGATSGRHSRRHLYAEIVVRHLARPPNGRISPFFLQHIIPSSPCIRNHRR